MAFRKAVLVLKIWTAIALVFAASLRINMPGTSWKYALQRVMPQCYAWALLTPIIFAIDRRFFRGMPSGRRILCHLLLALLVTPFPMTVDYAVSKALQVAWLPGSLWESFAQQFISTAMIYALIAGVSIAGSYQVESARLERQLTEARLHALQAQLRPHFLFNTLNSISAFTETDPRTARQMMACLGRLLRTSLDQAGKQEVPLRVELGFLEDYLTIERLRFEDRLTVDVLAEECTRTALVPSFLLQPLVENAILHGAGAVSRHTLIQVHVQNSPGKLLIRIEDDGAGLPEGWKLEDHAGVGLSNIQARLKELYGAEQAFALTRRTEGGVRVEIALPLRTEPV